MLNLKKTAVAVLALGSSAVFAGTMGPVCTPGSVTVPCERTAWDFGAEALYLQTGTSDYFGSVSDSSGVRWGDFGDDWGWGFKLEGSYHFGTGNDVNINWLHLDEDTSHTFTSFSLNSSVTDFLSSVPTPFVVKVDNEWDAVNFEFGQTVNFGEHKVIRFHGGAQYASIEREATLYDGSDNQFAYTEEELSAFGPRIGMDMSYHFGNGFAMYANTATALLVGNTEFNATALNVSPAVIPTAKRDTVVPEIEARLGVTYGMAMAQGELTLDVGWLVVNYFDAIQNPGFAAKDFNVNGVAFGAKWVGNIA